MKSLFSWMSVARTSNRWAIPVKIRSGTATVSVPRHTKNIVTTKTTSQKTSLENSANLSARLPAFWQTTMNYSLYAPRLGALQVGLALMAGMSGFTSSYAADSSSSEKPSTKPELSLEVLPPVTIAAHSFGIPLRNTGVSVTRISEQELELQGVYTIDDAIRQSPGVYVTNDCGQRGAFSPIRIRGLNQGFFTLNVVDGIRISDSNVPCSAFFGSQSFMGMETMEVVRGPQGALYGAQAIGGIVAFTLPEGKGDPSYKLFAEGGSFGSILSSASTQGQVGSVSYYVIGGYESTQNDPQHPAYFTNQPGDMDYSQFFQAGRFIISLSDATRLSLSIRHSDNEFQRPGYGSTSISLLEDTYGFTLASLHLESELSRIYSTEFIGGFYNYTYEETGDIDYGYGPSSSYSSTDYRKYQVEWKNLLTWNDAWKTSLGTAWDRIEYNSENAWTASNYSNNESIFAAYAEQFYQPIEGLDFSLAGRWENYQSWGNQFAWRFGTSWEVTGKDSPTRLFSTVGSGFRAPTMVELHGWGPYQLGNPNLKPTDAIGYDLGIEQSLSENHTLTVTGFWTTLSDVISSDSPPLNTGTANAYGVETSIIGKFDDAWDSGYRFVYTYTNPTDNSDRQLPCTAKHVFNAEIHTSPIEKLTVGLGLESAMDRANFRLNQDKVDNYYTLRLFARYKVSETVTIHARVENLTNQSYMLADERYTYWGNTSGTPLMARRIGFFGGVTFEF